MRIGLIGFGFMGGVHLSAIDQIEGVSVVAVSSRTRPTAGSPPRGNLPEAKSIELPPEIKWYSDWHELLENPDVDAVDICLPTNLHKEVALCALAKGKHVLCEKPMALTRSDCEEMLEAASRSDRVFMVGQVLRFMFPYRYAASFITAISPGSVKTCRMQRKTGYPKWSEWLSKEQSSGGAILDLLIHDIDQALEFFGTPKTVSAISLGEVDTMLGTLRYSNGLEVQIEGGWYAPELPFSAGFDIASNNAALSFHEGKLGLDLGGLNQAIDLPESPGYLEQMMYFVECCRKNAAPELCPPADSARAVEVAILLKSSRDQNGKELSCVL
jgi:predicted dehydrogenase